MRKIIDYKIISPFYGGELDDAVNYFIKDGWQPFGACCISFDKEGRARECQAMVKYEESTDE